MHMYMYIFLNAKTSDGYALPLCTSQYRRTTMEAGESIEKAEGVDASMSV